MDFFKCYQYNQFTQDGFTTKFVIKIFRQLLKKVFYFIEIQQKKDLKLLVFAVKIGA